MRSRSLTKSWARRWPSILLLTLVGAALAVVAITLVTPRYTAHVDLLVSPPPGKNASTWVPERTLESYARVLGGSTVAGRVVTGLSLDGSVGALDDDTSAEVLDDTAVLRFEVTDEDAARAAEIAESAAQQFVGWLDEVQTGEAGTALTASVVEPAREPSTPSSPAIPWWVGLGALAGLVVGLLQATARQLADRSVRTPEELEAVAGAPVLGAVAYDKAAVHTPLITSLGTHHPRFEAVRILRTNLQFLDIDRDNKVITITSSLAGEGKSTTACNLAIALAQAGTRVALVEGDLRRPRVSEYLGLEKSVGLTTVLVGRVTLEAAIQQGGTAGLDILASGALPPNPSEILQTNAMISLVSQLRHRYDVVLVDAPPLLPVTDASLLASISDGAILVVKHGATGQEQIRTAVDRLESVSARLLGTVLSMSPAKELTRYGYGYGYGYGPEYAGKKQRGQG